MKRSVFLLTILSLFGISLLAVAAMTGDSINVQGSKFLLTEEEPPEEEKPEVVNLPPPTANVQSEVTHCNNLFELVLTKADPEDEVYYSVINADGTERGQTLYTAPLIIDRPGEITYWAERSGNASEQITIRFTFSVLTPVISPESGEYAQNLTVTMTSATADAEIRYTLDGNDPDEYSALYTGPFKPKKVGEFTVKAKAFRGDWTPSGVASADYNCNIVGVDLPTTNVESEETHCNNPFELVLTKADLDDAVYYTLSYADGTQQGRTAYVDPVVLDKPVSVTYWAECSGVSSEQRTIGFTFSVLTPVITPESGEFTLRPTVTMASETADAEIRYTLDGSEPHEESALYTIPFRPENKGQYTVKAKAFRQGWTASGVASVDYNYISFVVDPGNIAFVKITSTDELADGDQVIIVCESTGKAMSKDENTVIGLNYYRKAENVSCTEGVLGNQVVLSENSNVQVLNVVKESDGYRFFDEDRNAYLCATSRSGNYIGTQNTPDDNSLAVVSFSGGNASIVFQGSYTRNMVQFDSASFGPSFSCYNTTKTYVQLYKRYRYTAQSPEELKGLDDGADFRLESSLLVTYVNGEYVYTYDMANDAYSLIIQENSGVDSGHILEDSWSGKVSIVNGQTRLIPDAPLVIVGYAIDNIPEPLEVTAENFFAVMTAAADARPVKLCNLHVAASTSADETVMATLQPNVNQAPAMNGVRGTSQQVPQVALRDVFGQGIVNDDPLGYDYIDGMANVAGNTMEVYPTSLGNSQNIVTEIETITTDNAASAKVAYYDLSGRPVVNPSNGIFIQVCGPDRKLVRK